MIDNANRTIDIEIKKELKLEVGARVKYIGSRSIGQTTSEDAYGKIGTVVLRDNSYDNLVEFDDNIGGHDGNRNEKLGKYGHCWYVTKDMLEVIG